MPTEQIRAGVLDVAYERHGAPGGRAVVLAHGFPYSPRSFDDVIERLTDVGADVVVPYLRGYGPTRFVSPDVVRSGQQAALAHDLRDLIGALELERPLVAGYDWGGRAACLVSLLWPESVSGLITVGGYNVQDIATASTTPAPPALERRAWYQYYLHSERGRAGLAEYRSEIAQLLWTEWSPTWRFGDSEFASSAEAFDNPDFVDVVVHSYRHRYGLVDGDPAYDATEAEIARPGTIDVPTVVVEATEDPIEALSASSRDHAAHFTDLRDVRRLDCGHNPPQELPSLFADAVRVLL
ncbi:alpha/beta fold hydrolase [Williamsia herbipolensis]|uniref:alpha/beta fold hydrolase n=1 Tax=Williamsia herbipolensis TaxID=1603258 RepID=UPI0005F7CAAB|nr:alpha/beta hydrolase [Williamsia herbipolensis]